MKYYVPFLFWFLNTLPSPGEVLGYCGALTDVSWPFSGISIFSKGSAQLRVLDRAWVIDY